MMRAEQSAAPEGIETDGDVLHLLHAMREELVAAVHEVNNPLAIISGNAQLLAELTREQEIDAEMKKSIADIAIASTELAARLQALAKLKETYVDGPNICGDGGAGGTPAATPSR